MLGVCQPSQAGYKEDMGFGLLLSELGGGMPTGSGVLVTQVEARTSYEPSGPFMPNTAEPQFSGKRILKKTSDSVPGASSHATTVGQLFYGNSSSLSPGVTEIHCYEANHYLTNGFLHYGYAYQPGYSFSPADKSSPSRVANHSWVGSAGPETNSEILRRLDFLVQADQFIQVVAPANSTTNQALLISSFNSISVGRSDGFHQRGSVVVDSTYTEGRTKPDLVVPNSPTSYTAPLAASAVALLVETGGDSTLSRDPVEPHTTDRDGALILNAQRSEVVKASLMAGANRVTHNGSFANIADYRLSPQNRSPNGLDKRFGAGQLDLYHSYHIIAAGEQNSAEDQPSGGGLVGFYGWDLDPAFGGADGTNSVASYHFSTDQNPRMLQASLVWNIQIRGGTWNNFNGQATLYDLDLFLEDLTDPQRPWLVAASTSTGENTENLWVPLSPGRHYRLQVRPGQAQVFKQDYALAWRITIPPDTDGDGMSDDWEVYHGFDYLNPGDGGLDADADGLTNAEEHSFGTDPQNPDTDGDGLTDGDEISMGSDPLDPSSPKLIAVPGMTKEALLLALLGLLAVALRARNRS